MKNVLKKYFATAVLMGSCVFSTSTMAALENCPKLDKQQVAGFFDRWNDAIKTQDPDKVVALYAENGVLLPTLSNIPRTNPKELRDYFVKFLAEKPVATIISRHINKGCDWALDTGIYEFKLTDKAGNEKQVKARYSYVYEEIDGKWLIVNHHSSLMPEKVDEDALIY